MASQGPILFHPAILSAVGWCGHPAILWHPAHPVSAFRAVPDATGPGVH